MTKERKRLLLDILVLLIAATWVGYVYVTRVIPKETIDNAIAVVIPPGLQSDLLDPALLTRLEGRITAKDVLHHDTAAHRALNHAANAERSSWKNPQSGHEGAIIPIRIYQNEEKLYCREYIQSVTIGESTYDAINNACRQPSGAWKMVEKSNGSV